MSNYYNRNYKTYICETESIDMSVFYGIFLKYVKPKGNILDLGAGSGRDSRFFLNKGFYVHAIDSSLAMVKHMKSFMGENVLHEAIETFEPIIKYDGIWASASLVHVKKIDIEGVILKYISYLNHKGIFYMSFKKAPSDYAKDGRYFNCYDTNALRKMLNQFQEIEILELFQSEQEKDNFIQIWVNAIIQLK
jgi:2-polyprenyl-3-methyl-5-hydroxy-6-metoxy-1,4-benzoquinol methylase